MKSELVIRGVPVPFGCRGNVLADFITPDWKQVIEFYPAWVECMEASGEEPWPIQPFILEVCDVLARSNIRPGRDGDAWLQRLAEHFGLQTLAEWFATYGTPAP